MTYQEWVRKQYEEGHGLSWQPSAKDAWEAATLAERERCAGICEDAIGHITDTPLNDCAKAIRAT